MSDLNGSSVPQEWVCERVNLPDDASYTEDAFGWYALIKPTNKLENGLPVISLAWMSSKDNTPGHILIGTGRAIYKAVCQMGLDSSHLAYIGFELGRASICAVNGLEYTQE